MSRGTKPASNMEDNGLMMREENWVLRERLNINGSCSMTLETMLRIVGLMLQIWYAIVATSEREWLRVRSAEPKKKLASSVPSSAQRSQMLHPIADLPAPAAPVTQETPFSLVLTCTPESQSMMAWITATHVPGWHFGGSKVWPESCKALGATNSRSRSYPPVGN